MRSKSQNLTQYVPKPNLHRKPRYDDVYMALCNRKVFFKFTVADQRKRKKRDDSTLKNVFLLTWKSNPQMTEREIVTNEKTSFAAFRPPPLE